MKIWFVDDIEDNRRVWLNSFPEAVKNENDFETFETVPALIARLEKMDYPDILFLDYFISDHRGSEVIQYIKANEGKTPVMIAHSSVDHINDSMIKIGAHLKMDKVNHAAVTISIVNRIKSTSDLKKLRDYEKTR